MAHSTSNPKGVVVHALQELFPDVPTDCLTLHSAIKCNGGQANAGDVVSFWNRHDELKVGELLQTVGVQQRGEPKLYCLVAQWSQLPTDEVDRGFKDTAVFKVSDEHRVKIDAEYLDMVFIFSMASDKQGCTICLPYERRSLCT